MIPLVAEIKAALGIGEVSAPAPPAAPLVTPDLLLHLGWLDPEKWAFDLWPACQRHGITTPARVAMALSNFTHETGGGVKLAESLNYTPEALLKQWPKHFTPEAAQQLGRTPGKAADQRGIANAAYGGRMGNLLPGDGWTYRGAGLIQATGRTWFTQLAKVTKRPIETLPEWLQTRSGAAESGCALWEWIGCNKLADAGDLVQCRAMVNVGHWPVKEEDIIGLDDVRKLWLRAKAALGVA